MAEDSDDHTIEISIEALTGTVYDLCVSPYETILGIKLKVQRLEGIPVYQQQLVWGDTELQDEFCLEEYCISSGAQLKLMVAMRGGPIHAQRVHVDMEDEAFLEIAELLDTQHGDKYALMLLRSGDDLEHASIVQVQMLEDDSMDAVRLSPIHVAESDQQLSMAASKSAQLENTMTKDKMKLLMTKLKKGKNYHQQASFSQLRSGQISRTGTGKVLIVENRAPSRVLTPAHRASSLACTHPVDTRRVDRKLVFRGEEESTAGHVMCSGKVGVGQRALSGHHSRSYDPEQDTPIITRKTASRIGRVSRPLSQVPPEDRTVGGSHRMEARQAVSMADTPPPPSGPAHHQGSRQCRNSQRNCRRKRRTSEMDADVPRLSTDLAHLQLTPPQSSLLAPDACNHSSQRTWRRMGQDKNHGDTNTCRTRQATDKQAMPPRIKTPSNLSKHHLPPLVPPFTTKSPSVTATSSTRTGLAGHLPSLGVAATGGGDRDEPGGVARKKRCMQCGKRMGLASTYSCRCGGLFCALHRYAEAHICSFDYKSEGRRLLARTNPVIAAQKLPKI